MSGTGEMIGRAVANRIASMISDLVLEEATLLWGFKDDIDGMKESMRDLEALMQDADDKARQGGRDGAAVREWLRKLKSVAYDVEDVLDGLNAAQLIKNSQSKFQIFLSQNNQLIQKITTAHNMKSLRGKIDKLEKEGQKLNIVRHEVHPKGYRDSKTFAVIIDDDMDIGMLGRDAEKEKIIRLLLNTEAKEDISIIPVVGLGGIGKTTLAQAIFTDKRVNIFDVRAWVYVSKEFDLLGIGKAIIRGANTNINLDNCNLQFIQDHLKKELTNKRYLIVLDDLWEEYGDNLEKLKQMLQHGSKGSKIIVTTRSASVVQMLCTGYLANKWRICPVTEPNYINLVVLSPDDCWKVMKRRVFGPNDEQSGLEEIGRQIALRCGGLPLVANALGQVMSEHRTIEAWEDIRDRKIVLDFKIDHQRDTLEHLMLSYYYMKPDFKMCFTYLAAFPKGFIMDSNCLIQQWSALGYIQARHHGQSCINYLLGMSFLQLAKSSSVSPVHTKSVRKLTMHDLVHDIATIIATDEFLVIDATKPTTWDKANKHYCRHARLINYNKQSKVFKHIPSKVRTIFIREWTEMQLPQKSFSQSKYLRILDLSGGSDQIHSFTRSMMPSPICRLILLGYLDVSGLPITSLPKSFCALQNMQTLILSNCSLEKLPANIGNLQKLCYLDLSRNGKLKKLPPSIKNLVEVFLLNLSGCSKLEELPESIHNLKCLQQLDMSYCYALEKLPDNFGNLPAISYINFTNCSKLTKLPKKLILKSLEHLNLSGCKELESLPEDFGNLHRLELLNMSDCYKIHELPDTFCQLKHLKDLNLSDCHDLKQLPEFFGDLSELRSLNLTSCSKLNLNLSYCIRIEDLPSSFGDLQLQVLDVTGCYSLLDLPDSISDMTSLTLLNIATGQSDVFDKAQTIKEHLNLPGVVEHYAHEIDNAECSSIVELGQLHCRELVVQHLEDVKQPEDARRANLRDMMELRKLILSWRPWRLGDVRNMGNDNNDNLVLENLVPPRTLENFILYGYMSKDFPCWMSSISSYLPYLIYLRLSNLATCDPLPAFGQLPNLRIFSMQDMPNIRKIGKEFYGEEGNCKKLRIIWLQRMYNIEEWWTTRSGEEDQEFLIPNLHVLEVIDCPKLSFLPYPPRGISNEVASGSLTTATAWPSSISH
uniref:Uncharacterized protein n=1 Tax=Leersia perrieri TaxID=77586 RepID=A0A0D9Y0J7_9ORYZ